jgi:hypothetical protein
MAEIWGSIIIAGAAVGGGYLASQGAKKAANTAAGASDDAITEQRRQFDTLLSLTAPQRGIGEQALNEIGFAFGYQPSSSYYGRSPIPPGASPYEAPQIVDDGFFNEKGAFLNPWSVTSQLGDAGKILDPAGGIFGNLFGNKHGDEKRNLKAFTEENDIYDIGNGMLALADGTTFRRSQLQDVAGAWYGATYHPDGDQEGWQQRYNALITSPASKPQNAGQATSGGRTYEYMPDGSVREVMSVGPQAGGAQPAAPTGLARADYRNFFASPDFQFRLDEGLNAVQNSAAARGGLYSGNALRGIEEYGQNLAAGELGNWFNRRAALAGIGQTATTQAGQGAMATGANVGNLLIGQGDARASGIIGQTNALTGTLNQLGLLAGSGMFGGRGYNGLSATGYGVPYGGRLA